MVVTEHYLSAEAGFRVLTSGGNAFDAAIATTLAEGVVNPHMHTFGGELSALGYTARDRRVFAVNGNTVAPRAATIEWFRKNGIALIPFSGVSRPGRPPCRTRSSRYSAASARRRLPRSRRPRWSSPRAASRFIPRSAGRLRRASSATFRSRGAPSSSARRGRPPRRCICRVAAFPTSARRSATRIWPTFRRLIAAEERGAGHGRADGLAAAIDEFYAGEIAGIVAAHSAALGGLLRTRILWVPERDRAAVALDYRGLTVHKCGPWSQGPVFLQQLALLEGFDSSWGTTAPTTSTRSSRPPSSRLPIASSTTVIRSSSSAADGLLPKSTPRHAARSSIPARVARAAPRRSAPRAARSSTGERSSPRATGVRGTVTSPPSTRGNMAASTPSGAWIPPRR